MLRSQIAQPPATLNGASDEALLRQLNNVYKDLKNSSTPHMVDARKDNKFGGISLLGKRKTESQSLSEEDSSDGDDKRKKKRYTWSDDLHRKFMASIFDIGLSHAKPKTLLGLLQPAPEGLTTEHIKSHLQKYRQNCQKTKRLFLQQYEIAKEHMTLSHSGKALNPGHHAYPFPSGDHPLDIESVFKSESDQERAAVTVSDIPLGPPQSLIRKQSRKSIALSSSDPSTQYEQINSLQAMGKFGRGRLVFIPDNVSATSSPSTQPLFPERNSAIFGFSSRNSLQRATSTNSINEFDEYTQRMEQQLSTQQIIQAQLSRVNIDPLSSSPANDLSMNVPLSNSFSTELNLVHPIIQPSLTSRRSSDNISLSFLDNASIGEWNSLAEGEIDLIANEQVDEDQIFKFLDEE